MLTRLMQNLRNESCMTIKAKAILKNRYWIIEDNDVRIGTLSFDNEQYIFTNQFEVCVLKSEKELIEKFGVSFTWNLSADIHTDTKVNFDVNGYPVSFQPYRCVFDTKRKISLFTKSDKSNNLYCAGYYILKFPKGWSKAFCPKLVTIEQYEYKGPFKTLIEVRQALVQANKQL
jgi:hypothetical protein